jgi:hypothetical protein
MKRPGLFLLVAVHILLCNGCTTAALWEEGRFARYHEPADPSALRIYHGPQNQAMLVQYNESLESDDSIRRRAYWLNENADRLKDRRKPRFVPLARAKDLEPVLVTESPAVPSPAAAPGWHATVSTNGHTFALYSAEQEIGTYELPVYRDASGRIKQVLLTPFAVVADLTIIGGMLAYWWLPSFAQN